MRPCREKPSMLRYCRAASAALCCCAVRVGPDGVGGGVGAGVGTAVGRGVGTAVGRGVGTAVGGTVSVGVGAGVLGDVAAWVDAACTAEVGPADAPHPANAARVVHSTANPDA